MCDYKHLIINDILIPSVQKLFEVDYMNIKFGVSERNICARLALHMENIMREYDVVHDTCIFADYFADVEYNRMNNGDLKTFENNERKPQYMVSDLIVHNRTPSPNYLAVEMKRVGNRKNVHTDKERLMSIVSSDLYNASNISVYNTLVGAYIEYSPKGVNVIIYEDCGGRGVETAAIVLRYDKYDGLLVSNV